PTDAFLKVETRGIEPIPTGERKGSSRDVAWLWVAAFANFVSLITGGLLGTFGLGVGEAIVAVAAGSVLAAILHGLLSVAGPRYGTTQVVAARHAFGVRGAYGGAFFTVFLAVGWFAVDCVIAAQAIGQLARLAGFPQGNALNGFALPAAAALRSRRGGLDRGGNGGVDVPVRGAWGTRGKHRPQSRRRPDRPDLGQRAARGGGALPALHRRRRDLGKLSGRVHRRPV